MPLPKAPPIGRLRNLAQIQRWRDVAVTDDDQSLPLYSEAGYAWCSVEALSGETIWGEGYATAEGVTHLLTFRYREDLTTEHHFVVKGQRYRAKRVQPDDARRFVKVGCELYGDSAFVALQPPLIPTAPVIPTPLMSED
jgi:head-tail adaptor